MLRFNAALKILLHSRRPTTRADCQLPGCLVAIAQLIHPSRQIGGMRLSIIKLFLSHPPCSPIDFELISAFVPPFELRNRAFERSPHWCSSPSSIEPLDAEHRPLGLLFFVGL